MGNKELREALREYKRLQLRMDCREATVVVSNFIDCFVQNQYVLFQYLQIIERHLLKIRSELSIFGIRDEKIHAFYWTSMATLETCMAGLEPPSAPKTRVFFENQEFESVVPRFELDEISMMIKRQLGRFDGNFWNSEPPLIEYNPQNSE